MYETKVIPEEATTVYISHPESSYGIFCLNASGDLFLNSDWGFYAYAWRYIGNCTFKEFIASTNKHYLSDKLEMNTNNAKQRMKAARKHLENLCEELIKWAKTHKESAS